MWFSALYCSLSEEYELVGLQSSGIFSSLHWCPFDLHIQVSHSCLLTRIEAQFYLDVVATVVTVSIGLFPSLSHTQRLYYCVCLAAYFPDCVFHHQLNYDPHPALHAGTTLPLLLPWQLLKPWTMPCLRGGCKLSRNLRNTSSKTTCNLLISATWSFFLSQYLCHLTFICETRHCIVFRWMSMMAHSYLGFQLFSRLLCKK